MNIRMHEYQSPSNKFMKEDSGWKGINSVNSFDVCCQIIREKGFYHLQVLLLICIYLIVGSMSHFHEFIAH